MSAIVDQNGQPFKGEIATVAKDITYVPYLNTLRTHDDTLLTRGSAKSYKIYDEIERDCHAYGLLQKRKLAVVARPWQVDPASEDPLDVKAADMVRAQLTNLGVPDPNDPGEQVVVASNFDLVCYNLLDAILKGFAVGEIMWDTDGREIVVREVRNRDQRRFTFDTDFKLRLKTWGQIITGEAVPARKFLVHTFGAKDGSPFGLGLGTRLFWPVFFKRQDITFWLTYLDKFGSPTAIGKYPNGTPPDDQDKLLDALAAIAQDAGVTVPEGMMIELLEAQRSGTVSYEQFARYMDEEMTFAVLGESPTSKGSGGALASAATAREEVRLELVQADADLLSATLNATLSPWLTAYNCPGARPPKIWRQVKKAEDLKARSERDKNVHAIGYRPTLEQITEDYGGKWEAVPVAGQKQSLPLPADFAEGDESFADQVALDAAINALPAEPLQAAMEKALKPVVQFIQKGGDPQEAMARIADVYPEMDTAFLEDMLARAIFVAEIWGRLSAEAEA
jgi:phage gp29-like protein